MSFDFRPADSRRSHAKGVVFLTAGMLSVSLGVHLFVGAIAAVMMLAMFAAALLLTMVAQRDVEPSSRDVETGLPDRGAALLRLEEIAAQGPRARRQAAVVVVAFPEDAFADAEDRRSSLLLAALRMAQRLRKGDQILRVGATSLAVILGPSRGLDARSARDILDRLDAVLREHVPIGERTLGAKAALGACLQNDAPARDARAWLEAAENAAEIGAANQEPHVYWLAVASEPARWRDQMEKGEALARDEDTRSA